MKSYHLVFLTAAAYITIMSIGCGVQRELHVRSEPQGAAVWVDEKFIGETPAKMKFTHYGTRRVRVGPLRDEEGNTIYTRTELLYPVKAPWYQRFPVDFVFEVLWPYTITDKRVLEVDLDRKEKISDDEQEVKIRKALDEAWELKNKSEQLPEKDL